MQVPNGTGRGVRRSKRPLLAIRTRCNVLWKFSNKVKIGNNVQFANWCNVWSIEGVILLKGMYSTFSRLLRKVNDDGIAIVKNTPTEVDTILKVRFTHL